ncbi:MAG: hypothetical protein RR934_07765, partial [Gordonibacter sp.]
MNQKIVREPLKIDLHIHSAASRHKDGPKVFAGTIENLPTLVAALDAHSVNMAAITDHDCFDYQLFKTLRSYAQEENSLHKVLPGVEFSVSFSTDDGQKPVHVVTIFDDADDDVLQKLNDNIPMCDNEPDYDCGSAFSEDKYWDIIRSIGLNIVTVAHQKATPGSSRKRVNDANSVGEDLYNEFLFMEYFEVYEYKNRKNELFNKSFAEKNGDAERLRFITSSDCHQWDAYPGIDKNNADDLPFTYLKCLPTFRGLAMAVTDASRIKTANSFFSGSTKSLDEIVLELDGDEQRIPLSPGINAIIGDNSVGKSSIMNSLVDFDGVNATAERGQTRYLEKMGVKVVTSIPDKKRLTFDNQESIRKTFEGLTDGKSRDLLGKHFPDPIDVQPLKEAAGVQIELLCKALSASCNYQKALCEIANATLPPEGKQLPATTLSFQGSIPSQDDQPYQRLIDDLKTIERKMESLGDLHTSVLTDADSKAIEIARDQISEVRKRHEGTVLKIQTEKKIANALSTVIQTLGREYKKISTDTQKHRAAYASATDELSTAIAGLVKIERTVGDFDFEFEPIEIVPKINPVGWLSFIAKTQADVINPAVMRECLTHILKARHTIDFKTADRGGLIDALKNYPEDADDPIEVVRQNMDKEIAKILRPVKSINRDEDDVYEELSQGFNAQMYFSLLRDAALGDGIYLVDQPEDQISQKAIKEVVINEFREIAESRQVLLITHNPQFLVNLDVDNVIFIGKSGDV